MVLWLALTLLYATGHTQQVSNYDFHGAEATLNAYKALYILNQSDDKKIRAVVRNINNALEDPRLKGKLQVELIAFGDGVEIYRKSNRYDTLLMGLKSKGVLLAQCENTLRERKISKDELWPFVSYVPSGNGEIIIRQYEGWAVVHP
jgi:intracellular sulfur oxidation DsrE/DsrF family protein